MTAADLAQEALLVVARNSAAAGAVAVLVWLAQRIAGDRLSARWRHNLWLLVALRLALPPLPAIYLPAVHWPRINVASETAARPFVPQALTGTHRSLSSPHAVAPRLKTFVPATAAGSRLEEPIVLFPSPLVSGTGQRLEISQSDGKSSLRTMPSLKPTVATVRTADANVGALVPAVLAAKATAESPERAAPTLPASPLQILTALWLTGLLILTSRMIWASMRLARAARRLRPVADADVHELLDDCCRLLHVRRAPQLFEAPPFAGPALVGAFRPRLLVPSCVLSGFAWRELRLILLHELAHLKRRDVALNYLLSALQAVHWFNPLVWLAFARLRAERELACDEAVLRATPWRESRAYGSTILKLLDVLCHGLPVPAGAMGVIQHRALMHRRIAMIARFDQTRPHWTASGVLLSLVIGGAALLTAAITKADDPSAGPQPVASEVPDPSAAPPKPEAPAEKTIQPGDEVDILMIDRDGKIETQHRIRVADDGTVSSPDERVTSHRFRAAGKTADQLRRQIQKIYGSNPDLRVAVGVTSRQAAGPSDEATAGPTAPDPAASVEEARSAIEAAAADPTAPAPEPLEASVEPALTPRPTAVAPAEASPTDVVSVQPGAAPPGAVPGPEGQAPPGAPGSGRVMPVPNSGAEQSQPGMAPRPGQPGVAPADVNVNQPQAPGAGSPRGGMGIPSRPPPGTEVGPGGYRSALIGRSNGGPLIREGERPDAIDLDNNVVRTVEDAASTAADEKTLGALQHTIRLQAAQQPLGELLENVGQQAGVDVVVDERAIQEAGVDTNTAVTMNLREPRAADQVLHLALRLAAGSQLDYAIVNGTVLVSTRGDLARHLVTRVYDLHDIEGDRPTIAQIVERATSPNSVVYLNPDRLLVTASENNQREVGKLIAALRQPQPSDRSRRPGTGELGSSPRGF